MRVRGSETALVEIEEIFSYIYKYNRSAATAVVERIERLVALLEEFPLSDTSLAKQTSGCCLSCAIPF